VIAIGLRVELDETRAFDREKIRSFSDKLVALDGDEAGWRRPRRPTRRRTRHRTGNSRDP
jgi:hypothetical protein